MSPLNIHRIYGMNVETSFALPAPFANAGADISIMQGVVPNVLSAQFTTQTRLQFDGEKALFKQALFGCFLLEKKGLITVDFPTTLTEPHAITATLGSGLGMMLHLRGNIPLHGIAIETHKGAIIILAESGCGKSTLATSLLLANINIFGDDIVALHQDSHGILNVHPSHRRFKLSPEQLEAMGIDTTQLSNTAPGINKFGWDIPLELMAKQALPIVKCIHLQPERLKCIQPKITPINQLESFTRLRKNVYRPRLIGAFKHEQQFFLLNQILQHQCKSYTMQLPEISQFTSYKEYGEVIASQLLAL
ncbi:hypothetical protein [Shewanella sp. S1-58-MNA-CIBAN-0166]|uniref:hypothetical protein n=1 Tax=Shewanella sp. S1-58-MNA-CIBAN-0166 TaxID=3140467 RepID=UPI0033238D67